MKKRLLISVLAIGLLHLNLQAQDSAPLEFGIEHSFNFTQLLGPGGSIAYSNRNVDYSMVASRSTLDFGLFAIIHPSEMIAIQPEVVYTFMGAHLHETTTVYHELGAYKGAESVSIALNYVKFNLPINIKFNEMLYLQTGGYVSGLLSGERYAPWWQFDFDVSRQSLGDLSKIDAGIMGGIGLSTKIVNLTFRYSYGLIDVFPDGSEYEELDFHNGVLQLVAHWKLYSDLR